VPKQLIFHQFHRDSAATEGDERLARSLAEIVDGRANNSFPVPVSPEINTLASQRAMVGTFPISAIKVGHSPTRCLMCFMASFS